MVAGATLRRVPRRMAIRPRFQMCITQRPFGTTVPLQASQGRAEAEAYNNDSLVTDPSPAAPEKVQSSKTEAQKRASLLDIISGQQPPQDRSPNPRKPSAVLEGLDELQHFADEQDRKHPVGRRQGSVLRGMGVYPNVFSQPDFTDIIRRDDLPTIDAPVRLDAFVGRSEAVKGPGGLAAALKRLEIKCAYNKVRSEAIKQKFHERPGLKRKRLRSERWRARFKTGFTATVQKVQKMRKQGW